MLVVLMICACFARGLVKGRHVGCDKCSILHSLRLLCGSSRALISILRLNVVMNCSFEFIFHGMPFRALMIDIRVHSRKFQGTLILNHVLRAPMIHHFIIRHHNIAHEDFDRT